MWTMILNIGIPVLRWVAGRAAKRKLNDEQFIEYVTSYQNKKARAGQATLDADAALSDAMTEMDEEESQ